MVFLALSTEENEGNIALKCFTLTFQKFLYRKNEFTWDYIPTKWCHEYFFKASNELTKRIMQTHGWLA